jgi:predicted DNA-binding transcriptional regulator AlpA
MEKQYYTAEEAMNLLQKSRSTFYREVEDGTIPSELEEGRKRGRKYPKEAIDAHVRRLKPKEKTKRTFGLTTNSELWASSQNHLRLYEPEDIVTYDRLLEWREANPDIFLSAREGGKWIAGVTMMPLKEEIIKALINEEKRRADITAEAIMKWTERNLTIYLPDLSVHHTGDTQKDRERGHFLMRSALRWALSLERQYDIKKWYTRAATPEGKKLVEHLGFEKIAGKRDAYLLTDLKRVTKPIRAFIDRLG